MLFNYYLIHNTISEILHTFYTFLILGIILFSELINKVYPFCHYFYFTIFNILDHAEIL